MEDNECRTIAETIKWLAEGRQKNPDTKCKNLISAMHAIYVQVGLQLCEYMKAAKDS